MVSKNNTHLSSQHILNSLVDLKQLVFEVTDDCNLSCRYCAFGDLYWGYDRREARYMSFPMAKTIIDHLVKIWEKYPSTAKSQMTAISFYGGEPLMNISLIRDVVAYVESLNVSRTFHYSMTSNCLLLDRYMDFLAEKGFYLMCSLDGDKAMDGYRVRHDDSPSFDKVFSNIKALQEKHPVYFKTHVSFNAVLHNLNSVQGICNFIKAEFDKLPQISELSNINIRPEKKKEFDQAYKNVCESLYQAENYDEIALALMDNNPDYHTTMTFLDVTSGNVFNTYEDLLLEEDHIDTIPTGTCIPFSKKMFVKVDGKIMPCERIPHAFSLGTVQNGTIHLDPEEIATQFNGYLDKMRSSCNACSRKEFCVQCVYQIAGIDTQSPRCGGVMSKEQYHQFCSACYNYLYEHPELYRALIYETMYE